MYLKYAGISGNISNCGNHHHDYWEICMNIEGEAINYADNESYVFKQGDIFICSPGTVHSKSATNGHFKDIYINIGCEGIFPQGFTYGYYKDTDGSVQKLLEIIHKIFNSDAVEKFSTLNALAESVCYIIKGKTNIKSRLSPAVESLRNSIIENFTNPEFKISDSSEYAFYNKDYMRQLFKKETGMSPLDFLNELRFKNAEKLLSNDRDPQYMINEISLLCGFYDVGYFTRMFRKKYGVTPSEYRKANMPKITVQESYECMCDCADMQDLCTDNLRT